jgi:hypothetical protein
MVTIHITTLLLMGFGALLSGAITTFVYVAAKVG